MADLEASIVIARDDLRVVRERLGELWEHLYAPDVIHRADSEKEYKPRAEAPDTGHALWTQPTSIQRAYRDVVAELARAHWALGQGTDVPEHWTLFAERTLVGERAPTIHVSEAIKQSRVLDRMLDWCQGQDLRPPEASAVLECCGHVTSARGRITDLWPEHPTLRRCTRADCRSDDGKPRALTETDGRVCRACRKRDQRAREVA